MHEQICPNTQDPGATASAVPHARLPEQAANACYIGTYLFAGCLVAWLATTAWGLPGFLGGLALGPLLSYWLIGVVWCRLTTAKNAVITHLVCAALALGVWGAAGYVAWALFAHVQTPIRPPIESRSVPYTYIRKEGNFSLIEEGLYQGGDVGVPPSGTTAVLNLCERDDPYRVERHRWESIADKEPAPSLEWLRRMVDFVDQEHRAGRTIYVHCQAGISRSGMVVVAYLMKKNDWGRDQALAYVRSKRPQTRPNDAFMDLLLDWESALKRK